MMANIFNFLNILIWLPIFSGIAVLLISYTEKNIFKKSDVLHYFSLLMSLIIFFFGIVLYINYDSGNAALQFVQRLSWIDSLGVEYHIGIDGISLALILLTTFMTPLVILSSWESIKKRPYQYFSAFLILEGLMIGVFSSLDAILFYVFWEAMLVPMFLIIGIWGGKRRIYATLKFFLYTFLGSVLMLVAFIYLHGKTGDFNFLSFIDTPLTLTEQKYIFIAFFLAFAVKVPMWPVHTWLPDAHVEAPTGGSVILAAIMLKMGGYGFIRLSLPMLPDGSHYFSNFMIIFSLIAITYIGFVALMQKDMKKLIAYSSIAHMGFVTLGFFLIWSIGFNSGAGLGVTGGIVQMVSHGLISGALFLCVGMLYDRMHSRQIADFGGVINTMPKFAALMVFFCMANAGLPGTSGFVGEFLVILASFKANFWYSFIAATTLVLGAAYTLWMVKRVLYGEVANSDVGALQDINNREFIILSLLAITILIIGVWPAPLMELTANSVETVLNQINQSKVIEL